MKTAELVITLASWSGMPSHHAVQFDSLEFAKSEFNRLEALLKKKGDKGNDVPSWILIEGINKLTCDFDAIRSVGLVDLARSNEEEKGVKEAFPYLNWRQA